MSDFAEWDRLIGELSSDKQKLKDEMRAKLQKDESNAQVLYRLAKVNMILSTSAKSNNNHELEKTYATEALSYADKGCKSDPSNAECHKWYCAAVGRLATLSSSKEKIKYGHEFKQHADIALKLEPNDQLMQSLYGQWCYSVASLGWFERKVAQSVYGSIPNADYETALNAFKKVHELDPKSKDNHLWMARVYIAMSKKAEAKEWITKGLTLKNTTVSDEIAHKELEILSKKY